MDMVKECGFYTHCDIAHLLLHISITKIYHTYRNNLFYLSKYTRYHLPCDQRRRVRSLSN